MVVRVASGYMSAMPAAVRDNTALSRFELDIGGVTAFVNYSITGGVITFLHTETPPQARGQGIVHAAYRRRAAKSPASVASK